ncbi:lipopolysaccharide biosynthesis protein [Symbiobacterium terraclitae]|nr:lipopolysaccharide biosynthesis protein [Symbiobacterium terraclitae]
MQSLKRRLAASPLTRAVAMVAGGSALAQALVVLTSPVITRVYSPEDMGVYALYTAVLAILSSAVCLRYELAVPIARTVEGSANLTAVSALVAAVISGLAWAALWLLRRLNPGGLAAAIPEEMVWFFPLTLLALGILQAAGGWATRQQAFGRMTRSRMVESAVTVGLQIGLGALGGGALGLVAGRAAGYGAGALVLMGRERGAQVSLLRLLSLREMWAGAVRFRRFPLLAAGAGLLNSGGLQVAQLLLGVFYGTQVAGWYALGQRMVDAPMMLVGQAVSQVYAAEVARLAREEPGSIRPLFKQLAWRLLLVGTPPILFLGAFGPQLFSFVFGPEWREAGMYTQVLVVMMLAKFVVVPLSYTLDALERQDLQLCWDAGRLVLALGALLAARGLGAPPEVAVAMYGGAMTASYLALYGVMLLAVSRPGGQRQGGLGSAPGS